MSHALYRGRRAARLENDVLRVTVLREGGHIAELLDKASGVSPLWTPPWPSIEPSTYEHAVHGLVYVRRNADGVYDPAEVQRQAVKDSIAFFNVHLKDA